LSRPQQRDAQHDDELEDEQPDEYEVQAHPRHAQRSSLARERRVRRHPEAHAGLAHLCKVVERRGCDQPQEDRGEAPRYLVACEPRAALDLVDDAAVGVRCAGVVAAPAHQVGVPGPDQGLADLGVVVRNALEHAHRPRAEREAERGGDPEVAEALVVEP
jgi:hypothetical protein